MADLQMLDCFQPELARLERVAYFNRMLLTADDMRADQDYVRQKLRRHNRFLHGWGVVCGLLVTAAPTAQQPWRVQVSEGYALGPYGDEIFVGAPVPMDLASCGPGAATNPCEPSLMRESVPASGPVIFLAIKYAECNARPVLAMAAGCACEDTACEYSRIRDSFEIDCLADLPDSHAPDRGAPSICDVVSGQALATCPPCPTEPWVVLAKVTLPASPTARIADAAIDVRPPVRRLVFSTAMIQSQLIACCCKERPTTPPGAADLRIVKKATRMPAGGEFLVAIAVTNLGPAPAENVMVTDQFSGGEVRVREFKTDHGTWTNQTGPVFQASLGTLQPSETASLSYVVALGGGGTRTNQATVKSDTPDPDDQNNHASVTLGQG